MSLCAIGLLLVVGHAWVAEDAYITFRVVDNAVNGYGLRWNVDERVEVYSNPLWLLIHIPFHAVYPQIFVTTLAISVLCSILAVWFAARAVQRPSLSLGLALILPLVLSKSFVEFSTSGLENPLSHLLAALFAWLLLRRAERNPVSWLGLSLVTALACVNRLDTFLLFLPTWVWLLVVRFREVKWGDILAGLVPLVVWKLFAFIYYGFPFPNTAYAKLATGVGRLAYAQQGLFYLLDLGRRDPVSFLVLFVSAVIGVRSLYRTLRGHEPLAGGALLSLGAALYGLYAVSIGGDFMAGRFWSLPFMVGLVGLVSVVPPIPRRWPILLVTLVVARGLSFWTEPPETIQEGRIHKTWHSIDDERLKYAAGHAMFTFRRDPRFRFSATTPTDCPDVIMWYAVGVNGYNCGPETIIVDGLALADPLLSRLPALPNRDFYVGHFVRGIPRGYMLARGYGRLDQLHPDLRAYYEKLRLITSGPLTSGERLATLARFNLGRYESLKHAYLASGEPYAPTADGFGVIRPHRPNPSPANP